MNRRIRVAAVVALLVVSSGCTGLFDDQLSFAASKATVDDDALTETGYEETRVERADVQRSFSVGDRSTNVSVTNRVAVYDRSIDLPFVGSRRAAVFAVVSTPEVSVLGQSFNPIGNYSNRELAALAQQQYGSLTVGDTVDTRTVRALGQSANVTTLAGRATLQGGQSVDVRVHVTNVNHGSDHVVAVAVHPTRLDGERQRVDRLLAGVAHNAS